MSAIASTTAAPPPLSKRLGRTAPASEEDARVVQFLYRQRRDRYHHKVRAYDAATKSFRTVVRQLHRDDFATYLKMPWAPLNRRVCVENTWGEWTVFHGICVDVDVRYNYSHKPGSYVLSQSVCLVSPEEVVSIDERSDGNTFVANVCWSDGHVETVRKCTEYDRKKLDAYRSFCSFVVLVSRVEYFRERDGDHAVATRVMRFLVAPEFLKRD